MKKFIKEELLDTLTVGQLEDALAYLDNPLHGKIPESISSLTETQWIAVEMVATQIQEEKSFMLIH